MFEGTITIGPLEEGEMKTNQPFLDEIANNAERSIPIQVDDQIVKGERAIAANKQLAIHFEVEKKQLERRILNLQLGIEYAIDKLILEGLFSRMRQSRKKIGRFLLGVLAVNCAERGHKG